MKRASQWLLNVFTVLSALLLIAATVASFRSQQNVDDLRWSKWKPVGDFYQARVARVMSYDGMIALSYERIDYVSAKFAAILQRTTPQGLTMGMSPLFFTSGTNMASILGDHSAFGRSRLNGPAIHAVSWIARGPAWVFILSTALLPTLRLIWRFRRSRRARAGHCHSCGYDLRATPHKCPECGTVPTNK